MRIETNQEARQFIALETNLYLNRGRRITVLPPGPMPSRLAIHLEEVSPLRPGDLTLEDLELTGGEYD